jgi:hypothetical protein
LLGDFNVPSFAWYSGLPSINCHYCAKQKGEVIYPIYFLDLSKYNYSDNGVNLLDLIFLNFADFSINAAESGIVRVNHYHPRFIIDCIMPIRISKPTINIPFRRYSAGDYFVLYDALSNYYD